MQSSRINPTISRVRPLRNLFGFLSLLSLFLSAPASRLSRARSVRKTSWKSGMQTRAIRKRRAKRSYAAGTGDIDARDRGSRGFLRAFVAV